MLAIAVIGGMFLVAFLMVREMCKAAGWMK
jgi:hypothetical protein